MKQKNYRVNFHSHSTHSDGNLSVQDLVQTMYREEVQWFALTDHDTVDGVAECIKLSQELGINCIAGIELSVSITDSKNNSFHLLAYDFDIYSFSNKMSEFYQSKKDTLRRLHNHLIKKGYSVILKENRLRSTTDLAYAIKRGGTVEELSDAYAFIKQFPEFTIPKLTPEIAIQMIHDSNGLAIMAHPFDLFEYSSKMHIEKDRVREFVIYLKSIGVDGIEVFYANFSKEQVDFLDQLADELSLIKSVGTDYHAKTDQDPIYTDIELQETLLLTVLMNRHK